MSPRYPHKQLLLIAIATLAVATARPSAAQLTVYKSPLTAISPSIIDPAVPTVRFDYCPGSTGRPPNTKAIPLDWEIRFDNSTATQISGVTYTDKVDDGATAGDFTLVCPATQVPTGATVTCDTTTNTITVSNVSVPPCGHTILRFQTIVKATPTLVTLCDGADVTYGTASIRTKNPIGNRQVPPQDNTCIYIFGACGMVDPLNLRAHHTAIDVNGPPLLPGDRVHWAVALDLRYLTDFPTPPFNYYVENNISMALAPVAVGIDPVNPDPFTAKPLVNAIYEYVAANRTIQVLKNPDPTKPVTLPTGTVASIVEWDSTVNCAAAAGIPLCNDGWYSNKDGAGLPSDDPNTYEKIDPTCVVPVQPAFGTSKKRIEDADKSGDAQRGETLTFSVDVINSTSCPSTLMDCECQASKVAVLDTFDLTFLDPASISPLNGGTRTGNQISWNIPSVPADGRTGNPATVSFTARVATTAKDGDQICNTSATVTSAELKSTADGGLSACPTTPPTNIGQVCITVKVPAVPSLSVNKTADRTPPVYCPGEKVTYTVSVTNGGGAAATGVDVWDTFDASWPFANINPLDGGTKCAGPPACTAAEVRWPQIATLAAGETRTFRFEATLPNSLPNGFKIPNIAHTNATNPNQVKDSPSVEITVSGPVITFTKALPSPLPTYSEGGTIEWTLTATNTGGCAATNLSITDDMSQAGLNSALDLSTIQCIGGSYANPNCTWLVPSLAPTQSTTGLKVNGKILTGTKDRTLCNTARATWTGGGPLDSTPNPTTCPTIQVNSPTCTAAPGSIANSLRAAKSGATKSDVKLDWALVPTATDGYNVYRVGDKREVPNLKRSGTPAPTNICVPTALITCPDPTAVAPSAGTSLYYQTRTLCGTFEDLP